MTQPGWAARLPGRQRVLYLLALAVLIAAGYACPLSIAMSPAAEPFELHYVRTGTGQGRAADQLVDVGG